MDKFIEERKFYILELDTNLVAKPKSQSFTLYPSSSKMFKDFKSLCAILDL